MSRRLVAQVHLVEGADDGVARRVADALVASALAHADVEQAHAGVHFDFAVGGGQITWDVLAASESARDGIVDAIAGGDFSPALDDAAAFVASIECAAVETIAAGLRRPKRAGVKRTLWLRVEPDTPEAAIARFEDETLLLARAIPAIRNWHLARVKAPSTGPPLRWTHLWEQEFDSVDGLQVDYMVHPAHWGFVDRWFDVEMPDRIVDPWLAHLACPATASVLSWEA